MLNQRGLPVIQGHRVTVILGCGFHRTQDCKIVAYVVDNFLFPVKF